MSIQGTLWTAEDINAVFDQDSQHVCILQSSVAIKHSVIKDKPIKDLLGNIGSLLAKKLFDRLYSGDKSKIPSINYLGAKPTALSKSIVLTLGMQRTMSLKQIVYTVGKATSDVSLWLETLTGPCLDQLYALLISSIVV